MALLSSSPSRFLPPNRATRRYGFSLIELLTVIVVISILSTITLKVMQSLRTRSEQVECMNTMRNIGVAMFLFAQDHGGALPQASITLPTGNVGKPWDNQINLYMGGTGTTYEQRVPLVCPADETLELRSNVRSYSLNMHISMRDSTTRLQNIPKPGNTLLLLERHSQFNIPWNGSCSYTGFDAENNGTISRVHDGKANYLFCDGHGETLSSLERSRYFTDQ